MRPVPKARHFIAALIFVAVSLIGGLLAAREDRLTDRQVAMATGAVRSVHEHLYARDGVYGDRGLWRQDNPVWRWYLRETYRATGREDIVKAFRAPIAPLVLVYLVGIYGVLWRQCRSWSVACYTAVLSTAVIHLADGTYWGLGPLTVMTPATAALAMTPLLVWAFLTWRTSPGVLWVFLGAGALANLHTLTGVNLALVLAVALIAGDRASLRSWLIAVAGLACAAGAASPIVWYHAAGQIATTGGDLATHWTAALIVEADPVRQSAASVLAHVLELPALGYLLALWLPALAVLLRAERYRIRELGLWLGILGGALGIGIAAAVATSIVSDGGAQVSPWAGLIQALRLTLLPLYVMLAQSAVHLLRGGASRGVLRAVLIALAVVWFIPTDNLTVGRHGVEEYLARSMPMDQRTLEVQTRQARRERSEELRALCEWLAAGSAVDAVIAGDDGRIRLWSQRGILACRADEPYYRAAAAADRAQWLHALTQQAAMLRPAHGGPADPTALAGFARRHGVTYAILSAQAAPPDGAGEVRQVDPAGRWGVHWTLWEIDTAPAE